MIEWNVDELFWELPEEPTEGKPVTHNGIVFGIVDGNRFAIDESLMAMMLSEINNGTSDKENG